jgi:hypothetical protein
MPRASSFNTTLIISDVTGALSRIYHEHQECIISIYCGMLGCEGYIYSVPLGERRSRPNGSLACLLASPRLCTR